MSLSQEVISVLDDVDLGDDITCTLYNDEHHPCTRPAYVRAEVAACSRNDQFWCKPHYLVIKEIGVYCFTCGTIHYVFRII